MSTRRLISIAAAILLLILVGTGQISISKDTTPPPATKGSLAESTLASLTNISTTTYPVVRVVDGDTLVASIDGSSVTVRLIGINTPEVVDPRKPVECFGREASERAKKILTGRSVRVVLDPTQGAYDKYGRLLAYVYVADPPTMANGRTGGTLFNKIMIEDGYAYEYTYNIPYQHQQEFKAAEKAARENARGLWSPGTCNGET